MEFCKCCMNGAFIDGQDLTVIGKSVLCQLEKPAQGTTGVGRVEVRITLSDDTAAALIRRMLEQFPGINDEILNHLIVKKG